MYRNKKIIITTFASRLYCLDILKNYILYNKIIDQWQFWIDTKESVEIENIKKLANCNNNIKIIEKSEKNCFFDNCIEENHIYIKIDEDICWMEDKSITNLIDFRITNPQYFVISGNIINNPMCDHIHHRMGHNKDTPLPAYECDNRFYINDNVSLEARHRNLLSAISKKTTKEYQFFQWLFFYHEKFNIDVISWFGEEFGKIAVPIHSNYEEYITVHKPKLNNQKNCMCGNALFLKFAYKEQISYMEKNNLLSTYKEIADLNSKFKQEKMVADIYYKLKSTQISIF